MTEQHNQNFINEMKTQLEGERKEVEDKLKTFTHQSNGDYQADFPEYGRSDEDNATEMADHAAASSTEAVLEQRLKNINAALNRVESGTYGLTSNGELIPEDRLRANPAATTLVE